MKVFVAGATGVVGRRLLPMLIDAGHEVVGLARSPETAERVRALGATPAIADALDRDSIVAAVAEARPDAVVHQLTAIPANLDVSRMAEEFAMTNRLRTEGTSNLLEAARQAGARRFVAQSIAFAYEPVGDAVKAEDAQLWTRPPADFAAVVDAIRFLERETTAWGGTVLRYGHFYGPGTSWTVDGGRLAAIRDGVYPIVGDGGAIFSFTHVDDAAGGVLAALAAPEGPGIFNIVDDDPAPLAEFLTEMARQLGGPAPSRVPTEAVRERLGGWGIAYSTVLKGASNAKAKAVLGWKPIHPSWRSAMVGEEVSS